MRGLIIVIFGTLGVLSRYGIGLFTTRYFTIPFPFGTFFINLVGSFLIGVVFVLGTERGILSPDLRMGLMVGFLGGFTTFSAYSLETFRLVETGQYRMATLYFGLSPMLGVVFAAAGVLLTRTILKSGT